MRGRWCTFFFFFDGVGFAGDRWYLRFGFFLSNVFLQPTIINNFSCYVRIAHYIPCTYCEKLYVFFFFFSKYRRNYCRCWAFFMLRAWTEKKKTQNRNVEENCTKKKKLFIHQPGTFVNLRTPCIILYYESRAQPWLKWKISGYQKSRGTHNTRRFTAHTTQTHTLI